MGRSYFSVEYEHPDHPDNYCSIDWMRGSWKRLWKSMTGSQWYNEEDDGGKLNQLAYEAIIEKFGLESLRGELPIRKIQHMSPASLVRYREERGLPHKEILSDTPTDREARAEEYE